MFDQIENVTVCRVLRATGDLGPFGRRELALKSIEKTAEHLDLPLVERNRRVLVPETGFEQYRAQCVLCAIDGTGETSDKPLEPAGYI